MPSKKKNNAPKNAFYFFMVSLRPRLERQGVVLENGMQSLAEIAGPRWKVVFVFQWLLLSFVRALRVANKSASSIFIFRINCRTLLLLLIRC